MFKMRQLLLQKKQKELSEYKAIGMVLVQKTKEFENGLSNLAILVLLL